MGSDRNTFTFWQMQCRKDDGEWSDYPAPKRHVFGRRKDGEYILKNTIATPGLEQWQWRIVETDRDGNLKGDA